MLLPVTRASITAAGTAAAASIVPSSGTKLGEQGSRLLKCAYTVSDRQRARGGARARPTSTHSDDALPLHVPSMGTVQM
jgi:hypothetical protein